MYKRKVKKIILSLCMILLMSLFFCQDGNAKISRSTNVKLTLENQPKIGEIAILKLVVSHPHRLMNADINCFLPEGLELLNDNNYKVVYTQTISKEWMNKVTFYSGPLEGEEKKEIIFKVHIQDGRKYLITAGGGDNFDTLEIDLGEPESPEWKSQNKERAGTKDGKRYILSGIKQLEAGKITDLEVPEDSLPPLRTEFRIRTKNKPYISPPYNPKEIPLRYLVYTEEEAKEVEVVVGLPEGLELINDRNYEVTTKDKLTIVKLFRGPMRFKECKAFYFKVRSEKKERFRVKAQTKVLTYDGKELIAEDYQDINLGKIIY